jgi:hypothetical protein
MTNLLSTSDLAISWKSRIHSNVIGVFPEPLLELVSKPSHRELGVAEPKAIVSLDLWMSARAFVVRRQVA